MVEWEIGDTTIDRIYIITVDDPLIGAFYIYEKFFYCSQRRGVVGHGNFS